MNLSLLTANADRLLGGLHLTILLIVWSALFAALLCVPIVLAMRSRFRWVRLAGGGYLAFFRGSPLIAQLFLIYYGSGQFRPELQHLGLWWFFRDAFFCSVLTFSLNSAAYTSALVHGAIGAVPKGQWEAARALGLGRILTFRKVVMPQFARIALPAYGNEIVLLIKASAITTVVALFDLMGTVRLIYSKTFDLTIYLWAALIYIALVQLIRSSIAVAERLLFRWP